MMIPRQHQIDSAMFLAAKPKALLASEPRTGKTGAAILAADAVDAKTVLVVTTASGRAIWRKAFADWQSLPRTVSILGVDKPADTDVLIVSWQGLLSATITGTILSRRFDQIILDESHKAGNPETKTTQAAYGIYGSPAGSVVGRSDRVAWLTGSPAPHDPGQLWPMLRAGCPELLKADPAKNWPDVTTYDAFRDRYCVIVMKKISAWSRIPVVLKGKNEDELHQRIKPFFLRYTQKDVGIAPPVYETLPLTVSEHTRRLVGRDVDQAKILAAIDAGKTKEIEAELSSLILHTGVIKAHAVVEAVKDELNGGLDKVVLMRWNSEVGRILREGLADYGVVSIDGSTTAAEREEAEHRFREDPKCRVFDGQIQAAGEAIDLSAACELWFVQLCWNPALLGQAAQRISNINQTRSTFVRACVIEGSIDEAVTARIAMLWDSIRQIIH